MIDVTVVRVVTECRFRHVFHRGRRAKPHGRGSSQVVTGGLLCRYGCADVRQPDRRETLGLLAIVPPVTVSEASCHA